MIMITPQMHESYPFVMILVDLKVFSVINLSNYYILREFLLRLKSISVDSFCFLGQIGLLFLDEFLKVFAYLIVAVTRLCDDKVQEDNAGNYDGHEPDEPINDIVGV